MPAMQPTEEAPEAPRSRKRGKWRRLQTIQDVRLAMARVIKDVYDAEISFERGAVCISGLRALGKVIHDSDLETRVAALEQKTDQ